MAVGMCGCTVLWKYNKIITFIGDNTTVILLRNITFLICLSPICSGDPFFPLFKTLLVTVHQLLKPMNLFPANFSTKGASFFFCQHQITCDSLMSSYESHNYCYHLFSNGKSSFQLLWVTYTKICSSAWPLMSTENKKNNQSYHISFLIPNHGLQCHHSQSLYQLCYPGCLPWNG